MNTPSCDEVRSQLEALELTSDELNGHLQVCEPCREELEALLWQDRMLAELAAKSDRALARRVRTALLATGSPQRKPKLHRRILVGAAAACLLVVPVLFLGAFRSPAPQTAQVVRPSAEQPPTKVWLDRVRGDVFVDKIAAKSGQELRPGEVVRVGEEGSVVIAHGGVTRVSLGGQSVLTWADGERSNKPRMILKEGMLSADVDAPMFVSTPHAEVAAQNAQFNLHADRATHVESEKGTVLVRRLADNASLPLPAGNFTDVVPRGQQLAAQPLPPATRTPEKVLEHASGVNVLAFAPDGKVLFTGDAAGKITAWDVAKGKSLRSFASQTKGVRVLGVSATGKTLVCAGDRLILAWDLTDKADEPRFQKTSTNHFALRVSPDDKTLTGCGYDRGLRRWEIGTGKLAETTRLNKYRSDFDFPACMAFARDGTLLGWGLKDNTARLWDPAKAVEEHVLRGHDGAVTAMAFNADGSFVATGSRDRTIKIWSTATGELAATLTGHRHTVNSVAFHPDKALLVSGGSDNTVRLWDLGTVKEIATFRGHEQTVNAVAFAPAGGSIASASTDGTVKLWQLPDNQP